MGIDQAKILPEFLEYALRCDRSINYYKAKLRGSTARRRSLPTPTLLEHTIPLPAIDAQRYILEIIHKSRNVLETRKIQLQKLDMLVRARFVEMFGDENNSKNWNVVNVEDVADVQVGVVIKPSQYYTDESEGVRAFRSLNIGAGFIKDIDWVYFTKEGHLKNSKSILKENDLLIVRSGAPGTACVVTEEYAGCNAVDIIIAHPDCEKVNPYYLCTFTNMPHGKKQIDEGIGGAAQQHFNVGKYNKLQLCCRQRRCKMSSVILSIKSTNQNCNIIRIRTPVNPIPVNIRLFHAKFVERTLLMPKMNSLSRAATCR